VTCSARGVQGIKEVMPPVFAIENSNEARSTMQYPPPLNLRPLPPMIIVEKGEVQFCHIVALFSSARSIGQAGSAGGVTGT
jgi:hypothetical protein